MTDLALLRKDTEVSVVLGVYFENMLGDGAIVRTIRPGRIISVSPGDEMMKVWVGGEGQVLTVVFQDEGTLWALGWTGADVDALRAAEAMRR